jgi:drug/metabolite transporter (DMT)-like permease
VNRFGILCALASAVLFGASVPAAKVLLGTLDPWILAGALYLGAGIGLAIMAAVRRVAGRAAPEAPLRRSELPRLALAVAFGGIAGPLLLMSGLQRTGAGPASLLLNLEGLATMAIAWLVVRENADRRVIAGAIAILAGGAVLAFPGRLELEPGAWLVAGACLCWGIDNNLTRGLALADPVRIATIKGLSAGAANLALGFMEGGALPGASTLAVAAAVGFAGYGLSLVLFVVALRHLGTARTAAYFSLAPFVGAALAVVSLGEPLTVRLVAAAALMGAGLWLHLAERHDHAHEHEPIEHEHAHRHDPHHRHEHGPGDPVGEPHVHRHTHDRLVHRHPHYPDPHHRHRHAQDR